MNRYRTYISKLKFSEEVNRFSPKVNIELNKLLMQYESFVEEYMLKPKFEVFVEAYDIQEYYYNESRVICEDCYKYILAKTRGYFTRFPISEVPYYAPYLYLQVIFCFEGISNSEKEFLIVIDEAQGIMPQELKLIKNINNGKVKFNLFGDIKQHVENEKGIDSWEEINHIADFKKYTITQNYRNARQITEYCNAALSTKMDVICDDGKDVIEIPNMKALVDYICKVSTEKADLGLKAVIVKNYKEAKYIAKLFMSKNLSVNLLNQNNADFNDQKWAIITVDKAKGLEFKSVLVISGNMTDNEKYIAYTRAMDKLVVYGKMLITKT